MNTSNTSKSFVTQGQNIGLFPKTRNKTKPFLKWAGGKTQLLPELSKHIPKNYHQYIEPFIGGGAFFFSLTPEKGIISDLNEELTVTYQTIRDQVHEVVKILKTYKNDETFFYNIRSLKPENLSNIERTARLIYLNKTCFNGLYRVNKKGEFNVPYGKRKAGFLNEESLIAASNYLQNVEILHGDYLTVLNTYAKKGDFIFLDPPYYPVGKHADFKRYTKAFFYHDDHVKLKQEFDRLNSLGCHVILTNSDHATVLDLYKDYDIKIIETKRFISSNPKTRTGKDIIVTN